MIAVETITVEAIASCADPGGEGHQLTIAVETIAVEVIASSVDPGGGGELTPSRHSVRSTGCPLVII